MPVSAAAQVSAWLKYHKLERYTDVFIAKGYDDLSVLLDLNKKDLDDLFWFCGVKPGHRPKLSRIILSDLGHSGRATNKCDFDPFQLPWSEACKVSNHESSRREK